MAKSQTISKKKLDRIVELLEKTGNIAHACREVGISRRTYYNKQLSVEGFRQRCDEALFLYKDNTQEELRHTALTWGEKLLREGVREVTESTKTTYNAEGEIIRTVKDVSCKVSPPPFALLQRYLPSNSSESLDAIKVLIDDGLLPESYYMKINDAFHELDNKLKAIVAAFSNQ